MEIRQTETRQFRKTSPVSQKKIPAHMRCFFWQNDKGKFCKTVMETLYLKSCGVQKTSHDHSRFVLAGHLERFHARHSYQVISSIMPQI